jgi:hypothetical protein
MAWEFNHLHASFCDTRGHTEPIYYSLDRLFIVAFSHVVPSRFRRHLFVFLLLCHLLGVGGGGGDGDDGGGSGDDGVHVLMAKSEIQIKFKDVTGTEASARSSEDRQITQEYGTTVIKTQL